MEGKSSQDERYIEAAAQFGAALERLARAYEADTGKQPDLLQDLHVALWRSMRSFDGRCSLRTWVYRVAHNAAATYVIAQRRRGPMLSLDDAGILADPTAGEHAAERRVSLERLMALIHGLQPLDRQVILCYLEGLDAGATAEITGMSAGAVATKIHRIKKVLAQQFHQGVQHGE